MNEMMRFRSRSLVRVVRAASGVAGALVLSAPAFATTTLTVDLSTTIRPVTHVGNGSLYGVLETQPADVNGLIAPLHPNMFTNPAAVGSGRQQPRGDAIVVAGRVAPLGATVTIRFADWFPGWYSFTNMTDWLSKVDQTVARKKSAGLTNIYAYEIWNEPNGTWNADANTAGTKPLSFNQMWLQTYQHLREIDPDVKITGPSLAGYNASFMQAFLSFCKTNQCLPDIVGWHEGTGISNDVQNYRNIEKQLGIEPLPITMNEYSGYGDINDEGRPGASAPLIAQLERSGVETACITYWDVPHPGRLGSLLASDTDRNGGWFFYQWYGAMTGSMVSTKSSLAVNGTNWDGFASFDKTARTAFVVAGGVNDGTAQVVVKGFASAGVFGSKVHVIVEHTPFTNRSTIVTATNTLTTQDVTVDNDQISVAVLATNGNDGYRVSLTPIGGTAVGGMGGSGSGSAGMGGASSASAGGGGMNALGGYGAVGGAGTTAIGGATGSVGGSTMSGNGGLGGTAGHSGFVGSAGGSSGSANLGDGTGTSAGAGTAGEVSNGAAASDGSCSCAMPGRASTSSALASLSSLLVLGLARRRRRG